MFVAASAAPAGGAEIGQVLIATGMAVAATLILVALVAGHRSGRLGLFARGSELAERVSGIRGWAALPGTVLAVSLMIAVFGMYWDVATHLDNGRDPGPLANPAHYWILIGLYGVLFAGVMALALPLDRAGRAQVTLPNRWKAPVGGVIIATCGAFSLIAFPLDDVWHRIFGQDVTLWGPTHLMLIGGAALSVIGAWLLQVEGLGGRDAAQAREATRWTRFRELFFAGALLVGLSTFQDEFDMAVPQFRLVLQPILLALAAGVALTAARVRIGRGGALAAVGGFFVTRAILAALVGGLLGHTMPRFPLYLASAIVVELVALVIQPRRRPVAFGAAAGLGIGTVGLLGEWGWTSLWYINPWPASMLPEALALGTIMAVAAGVLGGFLGRALTPLAQRRPEPRWAVPAAALVAAGVLVFAVPMTTPSQRITASVTARAVTPPPRRAISMAVRLDPPDAAQGAEWFNATSWQGGGSVADSLREVGPGRYVTTQPIPVYGNWKATLRLQKGRAVLGVPVFFPADPAIPAKGVPAPPRFTRAFVFDKQNLQREQKPGVPGALTLIAYLAVLTLALGLLGLIGWGLRRVEHAYAGTSGRPPATPSPVSSRRIAPA